MQTEIHFYKAFFFFSFYFPPTWKSLLFFWTQSLYLSNPKGSFPQTRYPFYPVFHTLCFSHSHLQTRGDASEESCFQQPLAGSRAVGAHLAVLGSSGCRGDFSFLNTHWHLLVLDSRDQHCCCISRMKSYFALKSSIRLSPGSILQPISASCAMASCTLGLLPHRPASLHRMSVSPSLLVLWSVKLL